jgi:hypothetical protein
MISTGLSTGSKTFVDKLWITWKNPGNIMVFRLDSGSKQDARRPLEGH